MLETAAITWIGGAFNGLNKVNGKINAYAVVGGSGTGKTRFLSEIVEQWDHWRDLSAAKAKSDLKAPSREIASDTLVFPIGFNYLSPCNNAEWKMIIFLLKAFEMSDYKRVITALATTRCLFTCYDVESFSTMTTRILDSLEKKTLNPSALDFKNFHSHINKYYFGKEVPVLILIDEVSKIDNDFINDFIPAMNRMMDGKLAIVWSTLAVGHFEPRETVHSQRTIDKIFLPALSPADSLSILKDNQVKNKRVNKDVNEADNMKNLKDILDGSLYLCWNERSERVLTNWDDVQVMLSEAAGGLPRGLEKMNAVIGEMVPGSFANESMPLIELLGKVSEPIGSSYFFMADVWRNSLYLAVFRASLVRNEMLNLNPKLMSSQVAEEAICGGCLIDARGIINPADKTSNIIPILPAIFPEFLQVLKYSMTSKFSPKSMETYIAVWLKLWFRARQACLYGTADNNNKPILQNIFTDEKDIWRPFAPFLEGYYSNNASIFSCLDQKCVLEIIYFSNFPSFRSNNPGIYLPNISNYEGLDAVVVIPSKSGKEKESVLIAVEAKNSLLERASKNVYEKLPSQYERTMKRMSEAGWTPGINAFFYVMSKGQLDDAKLKNELFETCPHMRVLAGEELKAAMGPTIFWGFKHLRVLGAVFQKNQTQNASACEEINKI